MIADPCGESASQYRASVADVRWMKQAVYLLAGWRRFAIRRGGQVREFARYIFDESAEDR
jgi:hypothetical protein